MKQFKFFKDNQPQLWGYIPFPFETQYAFMGSNDLWDAKCITNNLTDQMTIDILNNLQHDGVLDLDDNVQYVVINGYHSDGYDCLEISIRNDDGVTYEDFLQL